MDFKKSYFQHLENLGLPRYMYLSNKIGDGKELVIIKDCESLKIKRKNQFYLTTSEGKKCHATLFSELLNSEIKILLRDIKLDSILYNKHD